MQSHNEKKLLSMDQLNDFHRKQRVIDLADIRNKQRLKKEKEVASDRCSIFSHQVPMELRDAAFKTMLRENVKQEKAIDIARKYANDVIHRKNSGNNLIFVGPPGIGKSHIVVAIHNAVNSSGLTCSYVSMPHLIRYFHACMNGETGRSIPHALDLLAEPDLLVIDELGRHQATEFNRRFIWDLIDSRHQNKKPIVAATNSTLSELTELLDPAAMSRLTDRSSMLVPCDWKSYRGRR